MKLLIIVLFFIQKRNLIKLRSKYVLWDLLLFESEMWNVSDNGTQIGPLKPYTVDGWQKLLGGSRLTKQ